MIENSCRNLEDLKQWLQYNAANISHEECAPIVHADSTDYLVWDIKGKADEPYDAAIVRGYDEGVDTVLMVLIHPDYGFEPREVLRAMYQNVLEG